MARYVEVQAGIWMGIRCKLKKILGERGTSVPCFNLRAIFSEKQWVHTHRSRNESGERGT